MADKKIGIIASIPEEIDAFKRIANDIMWEKQSVFFEISGIGKTSAALATQKLILEKNPDFIIYIGTVGSLHEDLKYSDIVVASHAIDAELDARGFNENMKRGENPFDQTRIFTSDESLVNLAMQAPSHSNISKEYVASISSFLNTSQKQKYAEEVLSECKANIDGEEKTPRCIDMESVGVLMAAKKHDIPAVVIKTCSNDMGGDSVREWEDFELKGVKNYISVVIHLLHKLKE
jgi:nucleoside phosphorylase